jgi:16S rRNA (guanine527-N7)-methyltransferase
MTATSSAEMAEGLRSVAISLPRPQVRRLARFADLLLERALPLGMLGPHEADRIVPRHVVDSLRAFDVMFALEPRRVVDLGSGAGLPGIPLAVALPDVRFTLAEPRSKRAAFLELAVERLELTNVTVHPARAESLGAGGFDAATARAFGSPDATWRVARPLLRSGGSLVLYAGAGEDPPEALPGAAGIDRIEPGASRNTASSGSTTLASPGYLVIIRTT